MPVGAARTTRYGASGAEGSPLTCRHPALGMNMDSPPLSQRTVSSGPSTAVTTPLRVVLPTFSDSTTTWSPTLTILSTPDALPATAVRSLGATAGRLARGARRRPPEPAAGRPTGAVRVSRPAAAG